MKKLLLITGLLLFCTLSNIFAQEQQASTSENKVRGPKNYVKFNITSIALKNYSIQYERALTKAISLAFTFRDMPSTNLPFKSQILKQVDATDENIRNAVNEVKIGNMAFTPELRFYMGKKGYGRGFYIAPFYRYAKYDASNLVVDYEYQDDQDQQVTASITMSGNITANTVGLMFGAQWALGKYVCLDWWLLGPHYGKSKGDLTGIPSQPIPAEGQTEIRQTLEDLEIPMVKQTVEVSANKVNMKIDGPWAGIRAGISLGIRF